MTAPTAGDEVQLVVFRVGGQEFALNVFQAERILEYVAPSPLPNAPDFLEGVLPYGEHAVPLVDMRKRFGEPADVREETRIIVLEREAGRVGIIVDAVSEVKKVAADRVAMPSDVVKGLAADCIGGIVRVDDRTVVILNVGRLLTSTEAVALQDLIVEATDG